MQIVILDIWWICTEHLLCYGRKPPENTLCVKTRKKCLHLRIVVAVYIDHVFIFIIAEFIQKTRLSDLA